MGFWQYIENGDTLYRAPEKCHDAAYMTASLGHGLLQTGAIAWSGAARRNWDDAPAKLPVRPFLASLVERVDFGPVAASRKSPGHSVACLSWWDARRCAAQRSPPSW
jgi:hypothetical protein